MLVQPYLHDSRHKHASRRIRGPGGRFLTADEARGLEQQLKQGSGSAQAGGTPADLAPAAPLDQQDSCGTVMPQGMSDLVMLAPSFQNPQQPGARAGVLIAARPNMHTTSSEPSLCEDSRQAGLTSQQQPPLRQ